MAGGAEAGAGGGGGGGEKADDLGLSTLFMVWVGWSCTYMCLVEEDSRRNERVKTDGRSIRHKAKAKHSSQFVIGSLDYFALLAFSHYTPTLFSLTPNAPVHPCTRLVLYPQQQPPPRPFPHQHHHHPPTHTQTHHHNGGMTIGTRGSGWSWPCTSPRWPRRAGTRCGRGARWC